MFFKLDTPPAPVTIENGSYLKCFNEKLIQRETVKSFYNDTILIKTHQLKK